MKIKKILMVAIYLIILMFLSSLFYKTYGSNVIDDVNNLFYKDKKRSVEEVVNNNIAAVNFFNLEELEIAKLILEGARKEVKKRTIYNSAYVKINYPGGDVPYSQGACTDVVIRAFRNAGIDLQKLIHEDMKNNFEIYPQKWGKEGPDPNIDHRRVLNQICFFKRYAKSLTLKVSGNIVKWRKGDVVYWQRKNGNYHCGIISDNVNFKGIPLVIHNAGRIGYAKETDCLLSEKIIGHFRYYKR
jgi:hypothetical protein